ncbi:MAG: phosphohydrolase [Winogradskyella sp.]|uniref:Pycsar system effector family protein n=1 Tax=Winogradskyella sp. TaxID=1883156 RepID=UPI0017B77647|nr:phosphohydrolase [Winogradskyella sp.]
MAKLLQDAKDFVSKYFKTEDTSNLTYHNFYHTQERLKITEDVIKDVKLSEDEALVLQLAIAFSAVGYVNNYHNPFEGSKKVINSFFKGTNVDKSIKEATLNCFDALLTQKPNTKVEEYVLDVYYHDYGKKKYLKYSSLLRKEIEKVSDETMSESKWLKHLLDALTSHKYFSDYGRDEWQGRKYKNTASIVNSQVKLSKTESKEKLKAHYKVKYKNESPERSIQTLYRVALRNHIKLSDIADTKANILLSVNAIIISLVLANLISKLNDPDSRFLILPTIVFTVFCIASMVMSIKATQPNVTRGEFTEKDLKNKNVNLAFFGNFHKMELDKYQNAFSKLITNKDDVYNTLTKDLYFLGSVLDSKYRLLRYTYFVFMGGIIISVITFALAFIFRDTITL